MPLDQSRSGRLLRSALASGATLAGAYAGLTAVRWWYRETLPPSSTLPPPLNWVPKTMETDRGRVQRYVRSGTGTPILMLHSLSPAASSYDVKPIAEHLASETDRPLYAVDWLGFGRSDRPDIRYSPGVLGDQLYQTLTEGVDRPADVIALGRGCEYAAWMALQAAPEVRRLVLLSPTGLTSARGSSPVEQMGLSVAGASGAFEIAFYQWTDAPRLRDNYRSKVFRNPELVPTDLIEYAAKSAHVKGAWRAPYAVLTGQLDLEDVARELYGRLYRPTLLLTPDTPGPTRQSFDQLPIVLDQNRRNLTHQTLRGGLMPQWEAPRVCFEAVDEFLLH